MKKNQAWDLVVLPKGAAIIGYKCVFITERDSKGNDARYRARLIANGFTQKEGIEYHESLLKRSIAKRFNSKVFTQTIGLYQKAYIEKIYRDLK